MQQQEMSAPTIGTLRRINQTIRRAKQNDDLDLVILPIPLKELVLMFHSDAAFANACREGTQAGFIAAYTNRDMPSNQRSPWSLATW